MIQGCVVQGSKSSFFPRSTNLAHSPSEVTKFQCVTVQVTQRTIISVSALGNINPISERKETWKQPYDQNLQTGANAQAHLATDDLLIDLNRLIGEEWRITGGHLIDQHTERPPVDSLVVTLNTSV